MRVTEENIDNLVSKWHDSDLNIPVYEYVGLTWAEYSSWALTGLLPDREVVTSHTSLEEYKSYVETGDLPKPATSLDELFKDHDDSETDKDEVFLNAEPVGEEVF